MGFKYSKTFSTDHRGAVPKPTSADVEANKVLRADGSWVAGAGASTLADLSDTSISSPSDGQLLSYDNSSSKWKNVNAPSIPDDLNDLTDVDISSASDGQVITYDATNSKWVNGDAPSNVDDLSDLSDVTINTPLNNQALLYNSTTGKWINGEVSNSSSLSDLTDTTISSPSDGQVLKYDGTSSKWVNSTGGSGSVSDVKVNGTSVVTSTVANIKSYKELTQAQYDALPSSKLTDGILYCIKDDGEIEGRKFAPVIYSTTEREVGTWYNGKPVYQKTLIFENISSGRVDNLAHGIPNIEHIVNCDYVFGKSSSPSMSIIGFETTDTNFWGSIFEVENTYIHYRIGPGWNCNLLRVTLQYTKTTDVPGSGRWTSLGVPSHHYSETEQVIGTWIDGKPLYEKVLHVTATITSGSNQVYHYISNLGDVISISGRCRYNSTSEMLPIPYVSSNSNYLIQIGNVDSTKFTIYPGTGFTSLNDVYVTLQYTKST